jgi:hypothetical protein
MGQLGAIQAVAPSLGVELTPIDARNLNELERAVTESRRRDRMHAFGGSESFAARG